MAMYLIDLQMDTKQDACKYNSNGSLTKIVKFLNFIIETKGDFPH